MLDTYQLSDLDKRDIHNCALAVWISVKGAYTEYQRQLKWQSSYDNKELSKRDEEFRSIYPTTHPSTKSKECFSINIWAIIGFQVLTTVLFKVVIFFFFLGGGRGDWLLCVVRLCFKVAATNFRATECSSGGWFLAITSATNWVRRSALPHRSRRFHHWNDFALFIDFFLDKKF